VGRYRTLDAPFAEMAFYRTGQPSEQTFAAVLSALVEQGAEVIGPALIGDEGRLDELPVPNDWSSQSVEVSGQADVVDLLEHSPRAVFDVQLGGGLKHAPRVCCGVRALPVHAAPAGPVAHAVAVWCDGSWTSPPSSRSLRRQSARKLFSDFQQLIDKVRPSYAAFTVEMAMATPWDLEREDSLSLRDVFLADEYVGAAGMADFRAVSAGHPMHEFGYGLLALSGTLAWALASSDQPWNDDRRLSETAARLIVKAERRRSWADRDR
jgi:hypothetical protein